MKILPVEKIREADEFTIANEPISGIDLMERAAGKCFQWIFSRYKTSKSYLIFAGTGNNGGDGLVVARLLRQKRCRVQVFLCGSETGLSRNCRINLDRLKKLKGVKISVLNKESDLPGPVDHAVIIDSLFGSGLTRPAEGFNESVIRWISESRSVVISIDIPSGLFSDISHRTFRNPAIVRADHTLTFAPPKSAFFFPENDAFIGEWELINIGISKEFLESAQVRNFMLDEVMLLPLLKKRKRYDHKGIFGHALLICGSYGKMGAAVLAARGALRSGAGLVTVHAPSCGIPVLQTAVPESMMSIDEDEKNFSSVPETGLYTAVGCGCGLGTTPATATALKLLIQNTGKPLVFDADAINIITENKTWLGFLPDNCIFTPHPKELQRLIGSTENDRDRLEKQKEFSFRFRTFVVQKGAHTAITAPDGRCWFNTTGNPGMATGGSGDVLTGIITGLLAQGYSSLDSCLLGVWLHGKAGDLAAAEKGQEAMIAGDIINYLGKAFQTLYGKF